MKTIDVNEVFEWLASKDLGSLQRARDSIGQNSSKRNDLLLAIEQLDRYKPGAEVSSRSFSGSDSLLGLKKVVEMISDLRQRKSNLRFKEELEIKPQFLDTPAPISDEFAAVKSKINDAIAKDLREIAEKVEPKLVSKDLDLDCLSLIRLIKQDPFLFSLINYEFAIEHFANFSTSKEPAFCIFESILKKSKILLAMDKAFVFAKVSQTEIQIMFEYIEELLEAFDSEKKLAFLFILVPTLSEKFNSLRKRLPEPQIAELLFVQKFSGLLSKRETAFDAKLVQEIKKKLAESISLNNLELLVDSMCKIYHNTALYSKRKTLEHLAFAECERHFIPSFLRIIELLPPNSPFFRAKMKETLTFLTSLLSTASQFSLLSEQLMVLTLVDQESRKLASISIERSQSPDLQELHQGFVALRGDVSQILEETLNKIFKVIKSQFFAKLRARKIEGEELTDLIDRVGEDLEGKGFDFSNIENSNQIYHEIDSRTPAIVGSLENELRLDEATKNELQTKTSRLVEHLKTLTTLEAKL